MIDDKKELIRHAAIKVLSEHGFFKTKTSWIAAEAGVAVGTIYNYFSTKEAILDYIFQVELEKRLAFLRETEEQELAFWGKLDLFLRKHFLEIQENLGVGQILVREKEFSKKKQFASIIKYLTQIPIGFERMLLKAQETGEIKEGLNPVIVSSFIFGAIQGIVEKAITNDLNLLDQAAEELIKVLKEGLSSERKA